MGRVLSATSPTDAVTTYTYDGIGRILTQTNPVGATKTHQYNDAANTIITTDENGYSSQHLYTPLGQIQRVTDLTGGADLFSYEYDDLGRQIAELAYGPSGIRSVARTRYDSFDRPVQRTTEDAEATILYSESYNYDNAFQSRYLKETKTVLGDEDAPSVTSVRYIDILGREEKTGYFLEGTEYFDTYTYDYRDNRLSALTARDASRGLPHTAKWEYDYAGRVTKEINAENQRTETQYDDLGNKILIRDLADRESHFSYDDAGRLLEQELPFEADRRAKTRYYYDAAGNLLRQLVQTDTGWRRSRYEYDIMGRQTDAYLYPHEDTDTYLRTHYVYDAMGNRLELHTGLSENPEDEAAVTSHTYNQFGKVLTTTDPLGRVESCEYDTSGLLVSKTDRNGHRTDYFYDAMERAIEERVLVHNPRGDVETVRTRGYTKTGQKAWETQEETGAPSLTTGYRYDDLGRLIGQSDPGDVEKAFSYDPNGNRTGFSLIRGGEPVIQLGYTYDNLNRLESVSRDDAEIARYSYYLSGNRQSLVYPNGVVVNYSYNEGNLVTALENTQNGAVRTAFTYSYAPDGNQLSKSTVIGQEPAVLTTYAYDGVGRLIREQEQNGDAIAYEYDRFSNRSRMERKDYLGKTHITAYEYNLSNWLTKQITAVDDETETFFYRYDANGSQVYRRMEKTAPTGSAGVRRLGFAGNGFPGGEAQLDTREYNGFGQTITVCRDGELCRYVYRPDGLRHSKTLTGANGQTKAASTHLWDGANIVAEAGMTGELKARYLRGMGLLCQEIGEESFYYLHNAHGDVVQRIGAGGDAAPVYHYDAFGNQRDPVETDPNPFRYCGEYLDRYTEEYYLRARYYEPRTGRFAQQDDWEYIDEDDPLSLNLYTYAYNNPLYYSDPSGNSAEIPKFENRLQEYIWIQKNYPEAIANGAKTITAAAPYIVGVVIPIPGDGDGSTSIWIPFSGPSTPNSGVPNLDDPLDPNYIGPAIPYRSKEKDDKELANGEGTAYAEKYNPDPYGRANQKSQGRENKNKSRKKTTWEPRNNRRSGTPRSPKSHTPGRDHKKN